VAPALVLALVFLFYPLLFNIQNSLNTGVGIGIANFVRLFADPIFVTAIGNSILWVVLTTGVQMVLGFLLAYLIYTFLSRIGGVLRTILFLPMAVTPTVSAIVFTNIYAPQYGLLYGALNAFGLGGSIPSVLGSPHLATFGIMLVNVWQWLGFFVLMYAVGIAAIDPELLGAADVDGAVGWHRIRFIVLPLLKSTHWSLAILGAIQALQQFPLIYLMTAGGPANSSQVLATYIFQKGFTEGDMTYASAISVVLLALALIIAAIQLIGSRGDFSIGGRGRR
jgi:ABC-type sugar transport system permease subunit